MTGKEKQELSKFAFRHTLCYTLAVRHFSWDHEKNEQIKAERHVSFEEIIYSIEHGFLLNTVDHPNKAKYPNQRMLVVLVKNYVYLVPFVENAEGTFLKTIFPSRQATKKYRKGVK